MTETALVSMASADARADLKRRCVCDRHRGSENSNGGLDKVCRDPSIASTLYVPFDAYPSATDSRLDCRI